MSYSKSKPSNYVTKEQIVKVAQNVTINTIYFLSKQKKQEGKVYERNRKQKY